MEAAEAYRREQPVWVLPVQMAGAAAEHIAAPVPEAAAERIAAARAERMKDAAWPAVETAATAHMPAVPHTYRDLGALEAF